jgi:MFS family permease
MDSQKSNVALLATCQAMLFTNNVTLAAIGPLAGYALAADKRLATLPTAAYVVGGLISTLPASMWMRRVGRRSGFLTGALFALAGSAVAASAMLASSLVLLCLGTLLFGVYNAFSGYYRFAAADVAAPDFRARAISYVLAGGLVGGIVGPEASKFTRDWVAPTYTATYASLFVFALVAMAIIARLRIPPSHDSVSHEPARPLSEIVAQPVFVVAAGVAALSFGTMNLLMTATPLAMGFCGLPYDSAATVMSSHVIAMFAPSFFTGSLIRRFGVLRVMLAGVVSMLGCAGVALSGQLFAHFWLALVLLGMGWNFMYIGATTLLTEAYRTAEKAKAQGANEFTVFAVQAVSAFSSGVLVNTRGWHTLQLVALPMIASAGLAILWLWWGPGIPRPKTASGAG